MTAATPGWAVPREMVSTDIERVAGIEIASFTSPWKADTFQALLDRPGVELWVLDHPEDGVVAYAVLWCVLDQGELSNIAVAESHRGRGLGRHLLRKVLEVARGRGVASVYLEVRVSNAGALSLYRAFGFGDIGVRKKYYDHPVEDAVLMMKAL